MVGTSGHLSFHSWARCVTEHLLRAVHLWRPAAEGKHRQGGGGVRRDETVRERLLEWRDRTPAREVGWDCWRSGQQVCALSPSTFSSSAAGISKEWKVYRERTGTQQQIRAHVAPMQS